MRRLASGAVAESSETNNVTFAVGILQIRPDLLGKSFTAGVVGATLNVGNDIENDGPLATSGAFRIDYYLSTDSTITTQDVFLGSRTVTGSIAPNATTSVIASFTVPQTLAAGNYRVGVIIDAGSAVPELNETNNTDASTSLELRPDLVAVSLSASASGRTVTFTNTVRNDGALPAVAPFTVDLRLSTDHQVGGGDPLLGRRTITANLAPGASSTATSIFTAPGTVAAGTYFGAMWADGETKMTEVSESNNKLTTASSFFVGP